MDTRLAKRNYSIQQWKAIIHDRNNTNLTVDEYCKQNGLSRNSYFYWLRIIREEALELFFATPKYLKLQNAFPKVAAGNSSFLHVSPA